MSNNFLNDELRSDGANYLSLPANESGTALRWNRMWSAALGVTAGALAIMALLQVGAEAEVNNAATASLTKPHALGSWAPTPPAMPAFRASVTRRAHAMPTAHNAYQSNQQLFYGEQESAESAVSEEVPEEEAVPMSSQSQSHTGTWVAITTFAVAAVAVAGRYLSRLRTRTQVPNLIDACEGWAMAAVTGEIAQGTMDKALKINLDTSTYGSICEIGAGQEVGRIFFYVGASAGTIAKTLSAYDMTMSDTIYGECARYVTLQRLQQMLDTEYQHLEEQIRVDRPNTKFFAFADTVEAKKWGQDNECHGWMGMKFQLDPTKPPVKCMIHARLLDPTMQQQQAALGALGTNLMHACFYDLEGVQSGASYAHFLKGLKDDLEGRIEVDCVHFDGLDANPALVGMELVQQKLVTAVTFDADGKITVPTDMVRKQSLLISRDMPKDAVSAALAKVPTSENATGVMLLKELTLPPTAEGESVDYAEFQKAFDALSGSPRLLSDFSNLYSLCKYLSRNTTETIVALLDEPAVQDLFVDGQYEGMEGGILAYFGLLSRSGLKLMISPKAADIKVAPELQLLFDFLVQNQIIVSLEE